MANIADHRGRKPRADEEAQKIGRHHDRHLEGGKGLQRATDAQERALHPVANHQQHDPHHQGPGLGQNFQHRGLPYVSAGTYHAAARRSRDFCDHRPMAAAPKSLAPCETLHGRSGGCETLRGRASGIPVRGSAARHRHRKRTDTPSKWHGHRSDQCALCPSGPKPASSASISAGGSWSSRHRQSETENRDR